MFTSPGAADPLVGLSATASYAIAVNERHSISKLQMCEILYCSLLSASPYPFACIMQMWCSKTSLPTGISLVECFMSDSDTYFGVPGSTTFPGENPMFAWNNPPSGGSLRKICSAIEATAEVASVANYKGAGIRSLKQVHRRMVNRIFRTLKTASSILCHKLLYLMVLVNLIPTPELLLYYSPRKEEQSCVTQKAITSTAILLSKCERIAAYLLHAIRGIRMIPKDCFFPVQAVMTVAVANQVPTLMAWFYGLQPILDYCKHLKPLQEESSSVTEKEVSLASNKDSKPVVSTGNWSLSYEYKSKDTHGMELMRSMSAAIYSLVDDVNPFEIGSLVGPSELSKVRDMYSKDLSGTRKTYPWKTHEDYCLDMTVLLRNNCYPNCGQEPSSDDLWNYVIKLSGTASFTRRNFSDEPHHRARWVGAELRFVDRCHHRENEFNRQQGRAHNGERFNGPIMLPFHCLLKPGSAIDAFASPLLTNEAAPDQEEDEHSDVESLYSAHMKPTMTKESVVGIRGF